MNYLERRGKKPEHRKNPCSGRSRLHTFSPAGADGAKARSPKRSDGSLRCPTGELKLLAAQHEAGATRPQAALTDPPTAALTAYRGVYLPWGGEGGDYNAAPPAAHGSRVRLEARTARTFAAPLRAGVSKTIAPRAAGGSRLGLKRERGVYSCRCLRSRSTARARCGTPRAAQQCTGRARGTGVVHSQATRLAAAMGHASIGPTGGNVR